MKKIYYTKEDFRKFVNRQPDNKGFAIVKLQQYYDGLAHDDYVQVHNLLFHRFIRDFSRVHGYRVVPYIHALLGDQCRGKSDVEEVCFCVDAETSSWCYRFHARLCARTFTTGLSMADYNMNKDAIRSKRLRERIITFGELRKALVAFERREFSTAANMNDLS